MITDRVTFGTREQVWSRQADLKTDNFLRVLHPTGFRNLRALRADKGDPISFNISVTDAASVTQFARSFYDRNVYIGVATRTNGESAAAEDCLELHAVFVDMDFKDYASEAAAHQRLAAFPLRPSATIESGGGLQSYWFFTVPFDLQNGGIPYAKRVWRALATELGADLKSAEPARILRLPGTRNCKYDPPRDVVIKTFHNYHYSLEQLLEVLPPLEEADTPKTSTPLPGRLTDGSRNDTLFREGCRMRRLGWQEPEILAALTAINGNHCTQPLDAAEVAVIAHSCATYEPTRDIFPSTEAGDAEYLAACFGDHVRYDHRRGRWPRVHCGTARLRRFSTTAPNSLTTSTGSSATR